MMDKREIFDKIVELDPASSGSKYTMDDVGLARLFDAVFYDEARFNGSTGSWWIYDDERGIWAEDVTRQTEQAAEAFTTALYYYGENQGDRVFQRWAEHCQRHTSRRNLLLDASPYHAFTSECLDKNPNLLNMCDAVLDLTDFSVKDHNRDYMFSRGGNALLRMAPEKVAEGKAIFEKFVSEILVDESGNPDTDLARYVRKVFGYSMSGTNVFEQFFILYGPQCRNGKSALLATAGEALGSYAASAACETIASKQRDSRSASSDLVRLKGVRQLAVSEPNKRLNLDIGLLKSLTGNDRIVARELYARPIEFTPQFKMLLNCNFLPNVSDGTLFISGRVKVIPFLRSFSDVEQDHGLKERLRQPDVLAGCLQWMIDGLRDLRETGFNPPAAVICATRAYQGEADKLSAYWVDRMEEATVNTLASDVYEDFVAWCARNHYAAEGKRAFLADLRTHGVLRDFGMVGGVQRRSVVHRYVIRREPSFIDEGGVHMGIV